MITHEGIYLGVRYWVGILFGVYFVGGVKIRVMNKRYRVVPSLIEHHGNGRGDSYVNRYPHSPVRTYNILAPAKQLAHPVEEVFELGLQDGDGRQLARVCLGAREMDRRR